MNEPKVHRNDKEQGLQVEWKGVLLTLRPNRHHGLSGSIAVKDDDGKVRLLEFHGDHPEAPFPVRLHENDLPADES